MVPAARRSLTAAVWAEVEFFDRHIELGLRRGRAEPVQVLEEHVPYLQNLAEGLAVASLHWVTAAMARVMMDASQDVPVFATVMAPSLSGLVLFQEPLPAWCVTEMGGVPLRLPNGEPYMHQEPVAVDAAMWYPDGKDLIAGLLARPRRLPLPIFRYPSEHLTPFVHLLFPANLALDGEEAAARYRPDQIALMAFLASMWTLMGSPGTATSSTIKAPTGKRHPKTGQAVLERVNVVDLRTPPHRAETTTGTSGRKLTVRQLVRGHWIHQVHGPGRSLRKLIWVDPYIRGPKDAPLATTETVYQWRH